MRVERHGRKGKGKGREERRSEEREEAGRAEGMGGTAEGRGRMTIILM